MQMTGCRISEANRTSAIDGVMVSHLVKKKLRLTLSTLRLLLVDEYFSMKPVIVLEKLMNEYLFQRLAAFTAQSHDRYLLGKTDHSHFHQSTCNFPLICEFYVKVLTVRRTTYLFLATVKIYKQFNFADAASISQFKKNILWKKEVLSVTKI